MIKFQIQNLKRKDYHVLLITGTAKTAGVGVAEPWRNPLQPIMGNPITVKIGAENATIVTEKIGSKQFLGWS